MEDFSQIQANIEVHRRQLEQLKQQLQDIYHNSSGGDPNSRITKIKAKLQKKLITNKLDEIKKLQMRSDAKPLMW